MSEEKKDEKKEGAAPAEGAPPAPKKSSPVGGILKLLIPALLAAGASYGGTRYAKAQNAIVVVKEKEEAEHGKKDEGHSAPGPTVTLDPFILSVFDAGKKPHPMKVTVAVEFDAKAAAHEDPKVFMPRIRDTVLTHLRKTAYEEISDPSHYDKLRKELLEQCREVGAEGAKKVLITDFVIQ